MSVSEFEPREKRLLKINQSEPEIGHKLSPLGSQHSYLKVKVCSSEPGSRVKDKQFDLIIHCGLDDTERGKLFELQWSFKRAELRCCLYFIIQLFRRPEITKAAKALMLTKQLHSVKENSTKYSFAM